MTGDSGRAMREAGMAISILRRRVVLATDPATLLSSVPRWPDMYRVAAWGRARRVMALNAASVAERSETTPTSAFVKTRARMM